MVHLVWGLGIREGIPIGATITDKPRPLKPASGEAHSGLVEVDGGIGGG